MGEALGTFSVGYRCLYDPQTERAVDWDYKYPKQWARSVRATSCSGVGWDVLHGLDERAYLAILEHFGLLYWADEFTPERIFHKSPAWLVRERRKKEAEEGLKFLVIMNTAPHLDDCFAEDYE